MLTPEQRKAIFIKISELSGDNDEIMNSLAELQQDDVERGNSTTAYSEADVQDKDGIRWEQKFRDMQTKYRERFFGGTTETAEPTETTEPTDNSDSISYDDLFKKE